MAPIAIPVLERIQRRTVVDESTGCWLYTGRMRNGYGVIKDSKRKNIRVHRFSASYFLGLNMLDDKELALHKTICPNRNCWNPEHLYVGNHYQNQQDIKK
jgi:hypothetical protein